MAFNIRDVRRGLLQDGARASHFTVEIDLPFGLAALNTLSPTDKISLTGKASSYPQSNNQVVEVDYFGRKIKLAGNRTFEDWTITFYNDQDFSVRALFENWLAAINGHENNVRQPIFGVDETQASYKGFGKINAWGKTGLNIVKRYEMFGLFPTLVGELEADWGNNEVQTFPVTFAYDYWVSPELKDIITGGVITS